MVAEDGIGKALDNDRFGLGQARVGFEGATNQEVREGPVQFEKDTGDVFRLNQFLDEAKTGKKRGLERITEETATGEGIGTRVIYVCLAHQYGIISYAVHCVLWCTGEL